MRGALAIILLFALLSIKSTGWRIFVQLPSTLAHELAHWIVAFLFGCRPGLPRFWPYKEGGAWVLGSVSFTPRNGATAFVALAPMLLFPLALIAWQTPQGENPTEVLLAVLLVVLTKGGIPSSTDVSLAVKDPLGLAGVFLCGVVGYSFFLE